MRAALQIPRQGRNRPARNPLEPPRAAPKRALKPKETA